MSLLQRFWWSRLDAFNKRYDRKWEKARRIECPVKRQQAYDKINEEWLRDYNRIMAHLDYRVREDDW